MANYFEINGYWKDNKVEFEGYIVSSDHSMPTETEPYTDDDIFFYGLSEGDIKQAIHLSKCIIPLCSKRTSHDFVITSYKIIVLDEFKYFTLTDEEGRTAGIVKAKTTSDLKNSILNCAIDHYLVDNAWLDQSILLQDFIGRNKTITIQCIVGNEEPLYYDMSVESCIVY